MATKSEENNLRAKNHVEGLKDRHERLRPMYSRLLRWESFLNAMDRGQGRGYVELTNPSAHSGSLEIHANDKEMCDDECFDMINRAIQEQLNRFRCELITACYDDGCEMVGGGIVVDNSAPGEKPPTSHDVGVSERRP